MKTNDLYQLLDELSRVLVLEHKLYELVRRYFESHPVEGGKKIVEEQKQLIDYLTNQFAIYEKYQKAK